VGYVKVWSWRSEGPFPEISVTFNHLKNSNRRKVLYNFLVEFGIPMELVRLMKMCLNETYSMVRICNILSNAFPIQIV
jgi:hypothetical protein